MHKPEVAISTCLGLIGVGVMAGQGFHFNAWVAFFWLMAVGVAAYGFRSSRSHTTAKAEAIGGWTDPILFACALMVPMFFLTMLAFYAVEYVFMP